MIRVANIVRRLLYPLLSLFDTARDAWHAFRASSYISEAVARHRAGVIDLRAARARRGVR